MGPGCMCWLDLIRYIALGSSRKLGIQIPKQEWDKIGAVQVVDVATFRGMNQGGRLEDGATVETIIEKPFKDETVDTSIQR